MGGNFPDGVRKISDFIGPECDYLRGACNFTPQELAVFDLCAEGDSNVQISMKLHISDSTVSRLMRKVKLKIYRAL